MLKDIAVLTGGQAVTEDLGLKLENLDAGRTSARPSGSRSTRTTPPIVDGAGKKDDIEARVKTIRKQIEETTSDYDREKLQERLAKLVGGVAVIKVGAATEVEMKEKKARVEDALHATRAAVEEGVVPGGGVALIRAQSALDGDQGQRGAGVRRVDRAPRDRGAAAPDRRQRRASTARSSSARSRRPRARSGSTPPSWSTATWSRPA